MVVAESQNFFVFPSLGQLVEGYLLICSQEHFLGLSQIHEEHFQELENVKESVRQLLSREYREPIFFEHGCIEETKKAGCCVAHAHLHAIPLETDILPYIQKNFHGRKINSLYELRQQKGSLGYFYYENQRKEQYIFELNERVPSQYLRQVIAAQVGVPENWDWRAFPFRDKVLRTYDRLRGKIA